MRGITFLPLYALGFDERALLAYVLFVSFHAVWIHANLRFELRPLAPILVTPAFHHWHHAADAEAIDRNFAVHVPWLDRLFGSLYMPAQPAWPDRYGIAGDPVPPDYAGQLVYPFRGISRGTP